MIKTLLLSAVVTSLLCAVDIPTKHATMHDFSNSVELNAQVIQLSNAGQSVTSLVSGHLEKYFVQPGEKVQRGQKIAMIESIMISKMTAEFISYKKQYEALAKNYKATKKLYDKGMTSMQELNNQSVQKNAMLANLNALTSQLKTLGINIKTLKEATPYLTLYSHTSGQVSQLLQQLHTVISQNSPIINIVKEQAFYIKSFVPLEYASLVKIGQKMSVEYAGKNITTHVTQILPKVDTTTQRIVVLSSVDEKADNLFINAYVASTLYFDTDKKEVAVDKSALSFFNNEWVVFVPKEEEHDEQEEKDHEEHEDESHQEDEHEEENGEHEEHEVPYEARVVEIIAQDVDVVGIKGLEVDEEYVNDKSYYVKSMILKSSLGDGD